MNKKQQAAYDKTCQNIRSRYSHNTLAVKSYHITKKIITGEAIRLYMVERRMPAEFAFVLYELMDYEIDPMTLLPQLAKWVKLIPHEVVGK